ncbi:MAG: DUF2116 family Zn-ribbon domain-containing protein [Bacteroidales bacterium]|nr:DUF2116 family Zn-ribbon domain-containing protein [Bacteroidales bacterium]MBP5692297.1 DUF2116 family Zn-ribbon domain-containing protein [Bacteroidales bacterium]
MKVRKCPTCGRDVIGRADKRFCSDECRIFYNNALRKRKRSRNRKQIRAIISNVREMDQADAKNLLRLLERISKVFKIMSTFAKTRNSQK